MDQTKERLDELELRVKQLEYEIQILRSAQRINSVHLNSDFGANPRQNSHNIQNKYDQGVYQTNGGSHPYASRGLHANQDQAAIPPGGYENFPRKEVAVVRDGSAQSSNATNKTRKTSFFERIRNNESLFGKYLVGALASLLIFIAAASFVAIVWDKISAEVKLGTVIILGFALTALGFQMTRKKPNNISSIIFGTGIGLVYIAAMSANIVFSLISHEMSGLLSVLWTLLVLFSYRYTKLYFTMAVAATGSLVNLVFALDFARGAQDLMLVILYTSAVSAMLLYVSRTLDKVRNTISIFFAFLSFCLIFWVTMWTWKYSIALPQTVVTAILLLITNWMYFVANKENMRWIYLVLTLVSTVGLFYNTIFTVGEMWLHLTFLQAITLFVGVILLQFVLNHILYPNIERLLSMFYALPLYFSAMFVHDELIGIQGMAATWILLLFVLRKFAFKQAIPIPYMMVFVVLDLIFGLKESSAWTLVFHITNLGLLFYAMYEEKTKDILYKNLAVAILLVSYYRIAYDIGNLVPWNPHTTEIQTTIAYTVSVITVILVYLTKYFENVIPSVIGSYFAKQATAAESRGKYRPHLYKHIGLYTFSVILYFLGMQQMASVDLGVLRFVLMIGTLSTAVFQSRLLLADYEEVPRHIGIWLVVKYFILSWVMLRSFWELPFDSVAYSVVGLLLAIGAIYAGFKLEIKVIRQFGLAITILMVAKFILADLQGENNITRVIAFAVGGVLCFVISVIYNRLSKE